MNGTKPEGASQIISLRNVGVSYWLKGSFLRPKHHLVFKDVSFDLFRGDSLGVIGKNGCGKSTLLSILAGIIRPDYGSLTIASGLRASLLTLQLGFASHLSGRENAFLGGMFLGMTRRQVNSYMPAIVELADLGEFIDQPLCTYSSGMRARLGFAVAIQMHPDILLLDEVTGVGDVAFREKSLTAIQEYLRSKEKTVVFVSHAVEQVRSWCNRAIWLDEGVIKAEGDVNSVLKEYEQHALSLVMRDDKPAYFARVEGENTTYVIRNGKKKYLASWDELVALGGTSEQIQVLRKETINLIDNE